MSFLMLMLLFLLRLVCFSVIVVAEFSAVVLIVVIAFVNVVVASVFVEAILLLYSSDATY